MKNHRPLLLAFLTLLVAFLPLADVAAYGGAILSPNKIVNLKGSSSGSLASLRRLDQKSTADSPSKYVVFTTPGVAYRGYLKYSLASASLRSSISTLRLKVNYKGPAASTQTWSWYAFNWNTSRWTRIGANTSAVKDVWKTFVFQVATPQAYVNSSSGEIRIMLRSNNAGGNAKIDYEALLVTYKEYKLGNSPNVPGTCPLFPADNAWNTPIDSLSPHPRSANWISFIGASDSFHMDFGSGTWDGGPIGIPYNILDGSQVKKFNFGFYYPDESDAGPYPLPHNVAREYGSDHHILVVDTSACKLYEVYDASYNSNTGRWSGGSGAVWDLNSNALRPADWTSADAAGLPVLPGLVRYQEIEAALQQPNPADRVIPHALRFTVHDTYGYFWPARHLTSGDRDNPYNPNSNIPPMGARFRLKAGFNISGFSPELQVILRTMKKYGIIIADNGSDWYISGAPSTKKDRLVT